MRYAKQQTKLNDYGLTAKQMSQFYSVLDNDKKGLKVGNSAVLLIDDTPTKVVPDHILICYYGDNISPIIKAVYNISSCNYKKSTGLCRCYS